jgi:aerobic-type carbon monoxide dehydrogenase small subunit (CoxS/CutS family)
LADAPIRFTVNGSERTVACEPTASACHILRDMRIFSVRETCGVGVCGTCTVLFDGHPVSTCILPAYALDGREITTAEGLAEGDELTDLQRQFIEKQAFQCSFCTPGFLMSAHALLSESDGALSREEVVEGLQGHLCRCGCYRAILDAVQETALRRAGDPVGQCPAGATRQGCTSNGQHVTSSSTTAKVRRP